MKRQIVSEFRKLRTTRTAWGLLAGLLALTAVGVVALFLDAARSGSGGFFFLSVPMAAAWAFVLILGLRSFTDEFRHGSIVPTLLADPHRRRVLAAKLLVTAGAAVVFALAAAGLSLAIGVPWLVAKGVAIEVPIGPLAVWFVKLLFINVLWSAIGVGVGLAVRHQVAAIAGTLVAVLVGENIVSGIAPLVAKALPAQATASVVGLGGAPLTPILGAVVLATWTAGLVALGSVKMERRDVA
jgi:ABC-2 type transport system permease protein